MDVYYVCSFSILLSYLYTWFMMNTTSAKHRLLAWKKMFRCTSLFRSHSFKFNNLKTIPKKKLNKNMENGKSILNTQCRRSSFTFSCMVFLCVFDCLLAFFIVIWQNYICVTTSLRQKRTVLYQVCVCNYIAFDENILKVIFFRSSVVNSVADALNHTMENNSFPQKSNFEIFYWLIPQFERCIFLFFLYIISFFATW